jgi:hypothetical protein
MYTDGKAGTDRDRNASILQHFADDISASTRNVGVLQMKLELLCEGSQERHGSLVSQISSAVGRELMEQVGGSGVIKETYNQLAFASELPCLHPH